MITVWNKKFINRRHCHTKVYRPYDAAVISILKSQSPGGWRLSACFSVMGDFNEMFATSDAEIRFSRNT